MISSEESVGAIRRLGNYAWVLPHIASLMAIVAIPFIAADIVGWVNTDAHPAIYAGAGMALTTFVFEVSPRW